MFDNSEFGEVLIDAEMAPPETNALAVRLFASYWNTNDSGDEIGAGAELSLPVSRSLDVAVRISYYDNLWDGIPDREGANDVRSLGVFAFEPLVRLSLASATPVTPYVIAGIGYHFWNIELGEIDDEIGILAGLGATLDRQAGPAFFGEIHYRGLRAVVIQQGGLANELELDLSGLGVNIGISWDF